ncbi:hypothetical protein EYS14_22825 [Alteromonadaceae bacterium M269]|nr:hypothetical protein EYS14_22825 [Alteromonadaceae bacterium M269]
MLKKHHFIALVIGISTASSSIYAQNAEEIPQVTEETGEDGVVVYMPDFFEQYFPITALDFVRRVPGFSIDRGGDVRGFGGSAGNVLIDGERPSTKSDNIENILSRIGKDSVERVELIRGATGGLDLGGGQSIVVNVIRKADAGGTIPWSIRFAHDGGKLTPRGNIAYTNKYNNTNYTIGLERQAFQFRNIGFENLITTEGPDEFRDEVQRGRRSNWNLDIKTETKLANEDIFRLNFRGSNRLFDSNENSQRTPEDASEADVFLQFNENRNDQFEISTDYEHNFSDNFAIKGIGLVSRQFNDNASRLNIDAVNDDDDVTTAFLTDSIEAESIIRAEFDWNGWNNHTVQFGSEFAENFIKSESEFIENDLPVELSGANTEVSELRGEIFISDSISVTSKLTADAALAVERSTIKQTGDVDNSRTFTFAKPRLSLTYVTSDVTQWRLRLEQEVGQLNFFDFVSAANFDDGDVDIGNPELQPDRTFVAEGTYERRFGEIGVISATLFFNDVKDLIDLIPTGPTTEARGNVGNGKRYGAEINFTTPFDWAGIKEARADITYRRQKSSVTDLTTGLDRRFANERPELLEIEFRKELSSIRSSFGFRHFRRSRSLFFGVDEFVDRGRRERSSVFWETTFAGVKVRANINNLFNVTEPRVRTVFDGARNVGNVDFIEQRLRRNGTEYSLTFSGVL